MRNSRKYLENFKHDSPWNQRLSLYIQKKVDAQKLLVILWCFLAYNHSRYYITHIFIIYLYCGMQGRTSGLQCEPCCMCCIVGIETVTVEICRHLLNRFREHWFLLYRARSSSNFWFVRSLPSMPDWAITHVEATHAFYSNCAWKNTDGYMQTCEASLHYWIKQFVFFRMQEQKL